MKIDNNLGKDHEDDDLFERAESGDENDEFKPKKRDSRQTLVDSDASKFQAEKPKEEKPQGEPFQAYNSLPGRLQAGKFSAWSKFTFADLKQEEVKDIKDDVKVEDVERSSFVEIVKVAGKEDATRRVVGQQDKGAEDDELSQYF